MPNNDKKKGNGSVMFGNVGRKVSGENFGAGI